MLHQLLRIGKRGQISIFLILGLVIVTGLLVYVSVSQFTTKPLDQQLNTIQDVPNQYRPLHDYVTECLRLTAQDALQHIGQHGGYLDPADYAITFNPNTPTEGDGVEVFPDSGMTLPYWLYMDSKNNCRDCTLSSKRPPLHATDYSAFDISIESQLAHYITSEIDTCIENFDGFPQYSIESKDTPKTQVLVRDDDVLFYLTYPFKVKAGQESWEMKEYRVTDDIQLKKIYQLATAILENEQKYTFFERNTLNLISMASKPGINESRMPPVSDTDFTCGPGAVWFKTTSRDNVLKPLLQTYLPYTSVATADNMFLPVGLPASEQAIYANMVMPINESAQGFNVRFDYLGWPIHYDISPSQGDLIKPAVSLSSTLLGMCMHSYEFAYDISYPIMVEISDPSYQNGKGYSFLYAFEVNIRNNEPVNGSSLDFEDQVRQETIQVCDPEQYLSGTVEITVSDQYDAPVVDVPLSFCIPDAKGFCNQDVCTLGNTDYQGKWTGKTPIGAGLLIAGKAGYHSSYQTFGVLYNQSRSVEVTMQKITTLNISVIKKLINKDVTINNGAVNVKWIYEPGDTAALASYEEAMITMERINENEDPFVAFSVVKQGEESTIDLIPGTYQVLLQVISDKDIVIPESEQCWKEGIIFKRKKCKKIDAIDMDKAPIGGAVFNQENGYLKITAETLKDSEKVTFPAITLNQDNIYTYTDLEQFDKYRQYSTERKATILPLFN